MAKGHRHNGTNHRLTLNSGASGKPVERGRKNNKLVWHHGPYIKNGPEYDVELSPAGRKLFKKIRNKKRRMLPVDEVPGI